MEMAVFEIVINQDRRRESRLHELGDSVGCSSAGQKGDGRRDTRTALAGSPLWATAAVTKRGLDYTFLVMWSGLIIIFSFNSAKKAWLQGARPGNLVSPRSPAPLH